MDYFGFPRDLLTYTEDAIGFVERAKSAGHRYDYLIHDVFTGGAEPIELFTQQFIRGLHDLLEDDGVIALVRFWPSLSKIQSRFTDIKPRTMPLI